MKSRATIFRNRQQAGWMLAEFVRERISTETVVVGFDPGGLCVASEVSAKLELPLEFIPCHAIRHPRERTRFIGSICEHEIFLHDFLQGTPSNLLLDLETLRTAIHTEYVSLDVHRSERDLYCKTVVVCADLLETPELPMACIHRVRREKPFKIIVAAAAISSATLCLLEDLVDEIVILKKVMNKINPHRVIETLPPIFPSHIRAMLQRSLDREHSQKSLRFIELADR
jgi:putative phosphoribosyl transferase